MSTGNPTSAESGAPGVHLSVVMAVYDEEASLRGAVDRLRAALEACTEDFEIIVVDDGSRDGTGKLADALAAADPRVRVLHNEVNVNYGVSLLRGLAAARGDWILHEPADLPLAPEDVAGLLPHLDGADVLVVRRLDRSAHSPWRQLTSWVNQGLLRLLFRPRAADLNFVQFYRRSWVQGLAVLSTSPAFVTPELILRAEAQGRAVREVRAVFRRRERGVPHFGKARDIAWTLRDMLRFRIETWRRGWR